MYELRLSTYWPSFVLDINYFGKFSRHMDFYQSCKNNTNIKIFFDLWIINGIQYTVPAQFCECWMKWFLHCILSKSKKSIQRKKNNVIAQHPNYHDNEMCNHQQHSIRREFQIQWREDKVRQPDSLYKVRLIWYNTIMKYELNQGKETIIS